MTSASTTQAALGKIIQLGYLVTDVREAVQHWVDHLGVGPWMHFEDITLSGTFDGQATEVTINVAMGYQDEMQIELIEVTSSTPSPYQNSDGSRLLGPHHVAWMTDDLDAAVADAQARGLRPRFLAGTPTMRVAYLDSPALPGSWFELIENPTMQQMIDAGIAATREWDGSAPLRTVVR